MQKETFGEIIKKLRISNNLTLREIAELLKIDTSTLSKIEKNKRSANKELIKKIAQIFKFSEKELLINFLSDKVAYNLINEEFGQEILKVAEEKVEYLKAKKTNDN